MPCSRLMPLLVSLSFSIPCQAQRGTAPGGDLVPVTTFLRVAGAIGQDRAEFLRTWPSPTPPDGDQVSLLLSAADRLVVLFGRAADARDGAMRVAGVRLTSALPDTLALKRVVGQVLPMLFTKFGAPARCSDPLGGPSHLYAAQQVTRYWARGAATRPSLLTWRVSPTDGTEIELAAGQFAREDLAPLACDAKLP